MIRLRLIIALTLLPVTVALLLVLRSHEVNNSLTEEDRRYINRILNTTESAVSDRAGYRQQIDFIARVQHAVLSAASGKTGIPFDRPREPKQLYLAGSGLCYDRSRAIEKILRAHGFTTRHISIFSTAQTGSALLSLITPKVASHAVTEVLTVKGWVIVDSNHRWLSLDSEGMPVAIERLRDLGADRIAWKNPPPSDIYEKPFVFVYGLYSRHGRFYPPYDSIPDVNYAELQQNFR